MQKARGCGPLVIQILVERFYRNLEPVIFNHAETSP
jgi:hypothetical protein